MTKAKHTFFCPEIESGYLNEEESAHAVRVLRLKEGDLIRIVDGKGSAAIAQITQADKKALAYKCESITKSEQTAIPIHIAIAPTKSFDRFSFFLEKATELGCQEITPVYSSNSERKNLRIDKSKKVMISGLKQSENLFLPKLNEPLNLQELLNADHDYDQLMIAHCDDLQEKKELKDCLKKGSTALILIGPEGDFTPEEVILAKENGFFSVSLGTARFRTETAGILACHTAYLYL